MKNIIKKTISMILALIMISGVSAVAFADSAVKHTRGEIIEFGSYPQSKVTDKATLDALNAKTAAWNSYGYYSGKNNFGTMVSGDFMKYADVTLDGVKYRAVTFSEYRPSGVYDEFPREENANQYKNGYKVNTVYWFRYEPLKWRVLDPAEGIVMSESLIDSQAYSNLIYWCNLDGDTDRDLNEFFNTKDRSAYANDYVTSSIRSWLNNNFYNTAFTFSEKNAMQAVTLDNSSGETSYSNYNSASTTDKVFLLSYKESINKNYGFIDHNYDKDTARIAKGTDYAKCQGLYVADGKYVIGNSEWWLRSSSSTASHYAYMVSVNGYSNYKTYVSDASNGVRPVIKIDFDAEIKSSYIFTVDANGGAFSDGSKKLVFELAEGEKIPSFSSPSQTGKIFSGWDSAVPSVMPSNNITVYAVWKNAEHNHSYSPEIKSEATCTENGIVVYRCSCGHEHFESIPSYGHDWSEWEVTKPATADSTGEMTRVCINCADTQTKSIPATDADNAENETEEVDPENNGQKKENNRFEEFIIYLIQTIIDFIDGITWILVTAMQLL